MEAIDIAKTVAAALVAVMVGCMFALALDVLLRFFNR